MDNEKTDQLIAGAAHLAQQAYIRRRGVLLRGFGCEVKRTAAHPLMTPLVGLLLYIERQPTEEAKRGDDALTNIGVVRGMLEGNVGPEIQALIDKALLIIYKGELVTITGAAREAGMTVQRMSALVTSGKIPAYHNPDTPNPRRGRRLVRMSDVKAVTQVTQEIVQ